MCKFSEVILAPDMFLRRRQAILSVHGIDCCGGRHWNKARSWRPHCCCRGHWFSGAGKKDRCLAKTMLSNMLTNLNCWAISETISFTTLPWAVTYVVIFVGYASCTDFSFLNIAILFLYTFMSGLQWLILNEWLVGESGWRWSVFRAQLSMGYSLEEEVLG